MATKKAEIKSATTSEKIEDAKSRLSTISTIHGENYKTFLTEKYKNRPVWNKPNPKEFYSEIPGTVIKIYIEEGQEVKSGDLMMVLEAMKMKNKIYFSMDGVVKKIHIKEDQKIPKGHLMIELK